MIENSEKSVLLIDHKKLDVACDRILSDLSEIDVLITDHKFSDDVKENYKSTIFIETETPKTQKT